MIGKWAPCPPSYNSAPTTSLPKAHRKGRCELPTTLSMTQEEIPADNHLFSTCNYLGCFVLQVLHGTAKSFHCSFQTPQPPVKASSLRPPEVALALPPLCGCNVPLLELGVGQLLPDVLDDKDGSLSGRTGIRRTGGYAKVLKKGTTRHAGNQKRLIEEAGRR